MLTQRLLTLACGLILAGSPAFAGSESTSPGTTDSGKYSGMSENASRMNPGASQRGEAGGHSLSNDYTASAGGGGPNGERNPVSGHPSTGDMTGNPYANPGNGAANAH